MRKKELTEAINREIDEALNTEKSILNESVKPDVKFKFGAKELEIGSEEHVKVLKALLHGLDSLKNCYSFGSASRHVFAAACARLKRLIVKYSE